MGSCAMWMAISIGRTAIARSPARGRHTGSGDFDGGMLRLYVDEEPLDVRPEEGLLVAFPADVLHEVTVVRAGTRDAVVDWFYAEAEPGGEPDRIDL